MPGFSRRDFLKAACLTGAAAAAGCTDKPYKNLIPYVIPPEDIVPGEATWYATTCRECPAGCGILAKNRDGHVIKAEGNPLHPVNGGKPWGKLCPRGQASIQNLYNPDRFRGPFKRSPEGRLEALSWEDAEKLFLEQITPIVQKGRGERVVFLTQLITGTRKDLVDRWLGALGSRNHIIYETFAYEGLRKANRQVFGTDAIPTYRIDEADFLLSFGANFLETWLSNVQYARQFMVFHELKEGGRNPFVYVGPRYSLTAANADFWVQVAPEGQLQIARAIIRAVLDSGGGGDRRSQAEESVREFSQSQLKRETGVDEATIRSIAAMLTRSKRPLVIAEGLNCSDPQAAKTAAAANLLCSMFPGSRSLIDFADYSSLSFASPLARVGELAERMNRGEVDLLLLDGVNPVFHLPAAWGFSKGMKAVPMTVSFSSAPDDTSEYAKLVLPTHTFYETLGDYSPR
ncbi:MAG TPA: molybdopterin-dependent oxidoreductase, partial [Thermodesulfobacteriota bacterium]|nr:molybdopterin-dependent oxidoreductase [Thermodesulfobacteriota bacterium]